MKYPVRCRFPEGGTGLQRRNAIASLAALALAPIARAQPAGAMPLIGVLCFGSPANLKTRVDAFLGGMQRLGYAENRNVPGTVNNAIDQIPRSLQHANAVLPGLTRFASLLNPSNAAHAAYRSALDAAARGMRLAIEHVDAPSRTELERAMVRAASAGQ